MKPTLNKTVLAADSQFSDLNAMHIDLSQNNLSVGIVEPNSNTKEFKRTCQEEIHVFKQVPYFRAYYSNSENNKLEDILYSFSVNTEWLIKKCVDELCNNSNSKNVKPFVSQNYFKETDLNKVSL